MTKQELIKYFEELPYVSITQMGKKSFIDLIKQLDEPEKVKVPQFVAQHIEWTKGEDFHLLGAMSRENFDKKLEDWFYTDDNMELFACAWLFGYEVEKEKRYFVKIKATKHCFAKDGNGRIFFSLAYKGYFTQTELEKAGFGWVFDCEGIEVKEVE